jgi:putative ABC transport system permease protein
MIRDVHHACRMILRMPALAAVVVVSLGVGIGMNTVVFSWIQARVLQPLPGVPAGGSFQLVETRTETGMYPGTSWLEYRDLRERLRSFREVLAFRMVPLYLGEPGRVERLYGLLVSDNYFSALGLRPALGRFLRAEEAAEIGGAPVAVISYGLWQSRFGGSASALGQNLRVNGANLTVIGVTPRAFQGTVLGLNFEVWIPATLAPIVLNGSRELDDRRVRGYSAMGRLQPGVGRAQAQAELEAAMAQLALTYPETNATVQGEVLPLWQSPRGPQRLLTTALAILQALMLLLLLAVCGNTANLVLARASARQREMAIRLAIGAAPRRIVRLLLTESVVMAILGAVLALPIAVWGTKAFQLLPLSGLPLRFQTRIDEVGFAFAVTLGVACGLMFGAAPAMQLARVDPQVVFRSGSRSAGRSRLRNALMGIQVALALVVLIAAGLFLRSFLQTRDTDPGFRRDGVLLAAYDLAGRNASQALARAFAGRLLDRLRALPSVESAAVASAVPLDIHGLPSRVFTVDGHTRAGPGFDQALANTVTPGYFTLMGIPFRAGHDFADLDDTTAPAQVIVNEEFVAHYLDRLEPLGRRLQARGRTYIISGVVRNSLYNAFGEPPAAIIYFSYRDNVAALGEIHLRTRAGAEQALTPHVRRAVSDLDPEVPVFNVRTLADHVETNLVFRRVPARIFMLLAPLLLMLAAIGVYAVVAYTVSLRTAEIGVRLAVGASAHRVIAQVIGESLTVIVLGALVGWSVALVVAMDVTGGSIDLPVFAGVPFILLAVATIACWLPTRRITQMDPAAALRQD